MKEVIFISTKTKKNMIEKNIEKKLEEKEETIKLNYMKERVLYGFAVIYMFILYYLVLDWNPALFYFAIAFCLFYFRFEGTGKYQKENKENFNEMKLMIDENKKIKKEHREFLKEMIQIREKGNNIKFIIKVVLVDIVATYLLVQFFLV